MGHFLDVGAFLNEARSTPKSGHCQPGPPGPLSANNGSKPLFDHLAGDRGFAPCSAKASVLAHANTSSFSLASPCVMDEPCFAFSEATGHAPSATKAHVTVLGIVLYNALPEFAPH